jgi:hypothetical protein
MITLVNDYLDGGSTARAFASAYWLTRDRTIDESRDAFIGPFGVAMDKIDGATDAYSDDELVLHSIREPQMRHEVQAAMDHLRSEAPELFEDDARAC